MTEPTRVHVPLGDRAYDILIGEDLLEGAGERLTAMFPGRRFGIVTDREVAVAQLPRLTLALDKAGAKHSAVVVPNGSKHGSNAATLCWRWAAA
jgi:3-dehydroquinate synthase